MQVTQFTQNSALIQARHTNLTKSKAKDANHGQAVRPLLRVERSVSGASRKSTITRASDANETLSAVKTLAGPVTALAAGLLGAGGAGALVTYRLSALEKRLDKMEKTNKEKFEEIGQNSNKIFEKTEENSNKRFEKMAEDSNKRFEKMAEDSNKRFEKMEENITKRFEKMEENTNKRFEKIEADSDRKFERVFSELADIRTEIARSQGAAYASETTRNPARGFYVPPAERPEIYPPAPASSVPREYSSRSTRPSPKSKRN